MADPAKDKAQPIVIKKIVKGGGHHGGAWKVAYACLLYTSDAADE